MLFSFGCAKVRRVFLREPLFQFHLGRGVDRVLGEVVPLIRVLGHVVEFLTAIGIASCKTSSAAA